MIKKTIIIGLISFVFLIATTFSVNAADMEITLIDPEDDVVNMITEAETDEKPNIDIINVDYTKTGRLVTIDLEVNPEGEIEDRGDIDDQTSTDLVSYTVTFMTIYSDMEYMYYIEYVNKESSLTLNEEDELHVTHDVVDDSILSLSFNLKSVDEQFFAFIIMTVDSDETGLNFFRDDFYHISEALFVLADKEYIGETGEIIDFSGGAYGGTEPYTYSWDWGDGTQSDESSGTSLDELSAEHTYKKAGTYTATLTVTDSEGNVSSYTSTVKITGEDTSDDSDSGLIMFVALIAIIVVIGLAVVVYVKRR